MLFYLMNRIKVTNHKKIIKVSDKLIEIECKKRTYVIKGEELKISYFSKEELIISGVATRIEINNEK